jgi:aromatic-amino-acid transaminase
MTGATPAEAVSPFARVEELPPDPILGLTEAFKKDPNPHKVNLGVGVYQNEQGKVPVMRAVHAAEERLTGQDAPKTYLPIDGLEPYDRQTQTLLFGAGSPLPVAERVVTVQALGGTGALKVGADFLRRTLGSPRVWISTPSWENHQALFEAAGFEVNRYPYYDPNTHQLDFDGMAGALDALPPRSVVVLHACCHNPTGVDPSRDRWRDLVALLRRRELLPFLDMAYQGFAQGIEEDAFAVRLVAEAGLPCLIASSYSKSFSLYGERVGALTLLTDGPEESRRVLSQLKRAIRTNYSNPPAHGAQLVAAILADNALREQWEQELGEMRERIHRMRHLLAETLRAQGVAQDFRFIIRQNGMFSYSGLPLEAVRRLRSDYGIYILDSGRICVAALNAANIGYVGESIARVLAQ